MPGNTKAIVLDGNGTPAPQHYDPVQDAYDYSGGAGGIQAFRPAPEGSNKFACIPAEIAGLGAYLAVKNTPGVLFEVVVTNTGTVPYYVLVFDNVSATPAGLNNPRLVYIAPPGVTATFKVGAGIYGKYFGNGILIGVSTTVPAYTASPNVCWIMAAAI